MDSNNMEKIFNDLCSNIEKKKCPDLWPQVRLAITPAQTAHIKYRAFRVTAFATAALAVVLCIPGVAQTIKDRLARIFSSQYSVKLPDSPEMTGNLVSTDGEMCELRSGGTILQVKVSSFGEKAVKIEAFVFKEQDVSGKPVRKVIAKPIIIGLIGRPLEMRVRNADSAEFILKMTPSERDKKDYSAALIPQYLPETLSRTDAIKSEVLDIEAMYWAWRITGIKDMTYSDLEKDSRSWVMSPEFRKTLCDKVHGVIASGKSRPLTADEEKQRTDSIRQLSTLPRTGK